MMQTMQEARLRSQNCGGEADNPYILIGQINRLVPRVDRVNLQSIMSMVIQRNSVMLGQPWFKACLSKLDCRPSPTACGCEAPHALVRYHDHSCTLHTQNRIGTRHPGCKSVSTLHLYLRVYNLPNGLVLWS
jgi:hypothetical protein